MSDITIKPLLAVINGYVEIPDGQNMHRTKLKPADVLSLIAGSSLIKTGRGIVENMPSTVTVQVLTETNKTQDRLFIALPAHLPENGFGTDWYNILRTAAAAIA